MPNNPEISVIIATCYRIDLVLDCITSILRNSFENFEILVVDQDPKKELETELLRRFNRDPRLIYLFLDQAILSRARNVGIKQARGRILVFADDDLEVGPDWLMSYISAFAAVDPPPGIVAGRLDPLWLATKPAWLPEEREYLLGLYSKNGSQPIPMPEGDLPIGANFAVLRSVVDEVGLFDERVGYSYARKASLIGGEDSLFSLKVKQANYAIYYQPSAIAWHKISESKLTVKYFLRRNFWDGVTLITVFFLSGTVVRDGCAGIIRWHLKEIGRNLKRLFFSGHGPIARMIQSKAWVLTLALCANSIGIIYAALKLYCSGKLP
jgi:glucosyl-dolichyl phosphate glucuronosyltransferase